MLPKWEIDIDDDTADYYRGLKTPLGKKIQDHMEKGPDGWHFKLTDKGFCALLRTDGLCEVITALGEDKLCDICTVHPRFFTYVDEFILCGTGLCCEASCELLLAPHEPLTFTEEDTAFIYTFKELLDFMGFSLPESLTHYAPLFSSKSCQSILADLMITEPIDEAWTEEIRSLQGMIPALLEKVASYEKTYDPISFDRIYQFIFTVSLIKSKPTALMRSAPMPGAARTSSSWKQPFTATLKKPCAAGPNRLNMIQIMWIGYWNGFNFYSVQKSGSFDEVRESIA